MNLITTLDHAFATAAKDLVAAAKFVQSHVLPVLERTCAQASTIEAVTGLVSPAAVNVERVAYAALGSVVKCIQDAGQAVAAGGLNIQFDAALIADIKSIIPALKPQATALMSSASATTTAK